MRMMCVGLNFGFAVRSASIEGAGDPAVVVVGEDDNTAATAPDVVVDDDVEGSEKLPKTATRNADGTVSLTLREPVELSIKRGGAVVRSETYAELTFNRMTGADLAAMAATSDEARLSVMVGRSLRLSLAIASALFAKMDARDARDAARCAGFFMGTGE